MAVSREIRGSQEDAQNQPDIPRMIELGEKSLAFPSRPIFAPPASPRFWHSPHKIRKYCAGSRVFFSARAAESPRFGRQHLIYD